MLSIVRISDTIHSIIFESYSDGKSKPSGETSGPDSYDSCAHEDNDKMDEAVVPNNNHRKKFIKIQVDLDTVEVDEYKRSVFLRNENVTLILVDESEMKMLIEVIFECLCFHFYKNRIIAA